MTKKAVFASFLLAAMSCSTAHAQFEPLAFAICKKITADTARLKCFDEIGSTNADAQPKPTLTEKQEWQYVIDKSPLDDSPQVMATLRATNGATLMLRCKDNHTDAAFIPADFFVTGIGDTVPVVIRIDDQPAASFRWAKSTSGNATFASHAIPFIRLLPDNGKLFIRATGFQGRQADGLFNLVDVSSARAKIEEACKWSTPKADRVTAPATNAARSPEAVAKSKKSAGPMVLPGH